MVVNFFKIRSTLLTIITWSFFSFCSIAQEVVFDTLLYYPLLRGSDAQTNLNYALMQAASKGNNIGIDWLMRHGAEIDARTADNVRPIMLAVAARKKETVELLLNYDPELDFLSFYNESPLMISVKNQDPDIAELLIRDSASVNFQDRHGFTALHLAAIYGNFQIADMLLYYDADVNIKSNDGTTPLMVAVYGGHANITDLFLQNRANVLDSDKDGFSSVHIAAQNADTLVMDLLLARGARVNAVNKYGYDPLDIAIRMNDSTTAKYLIRLKKKFNVESDKLVDPYLVATSYKRSNMIKLLRQSGFSMPEGTGFDQVAFSLNSKVTFHDLYIGFNISTSEPIHKLGIFGGFDMKPAWSRVLVKIDDELFYQYFDKSYLAYAGVLKEFSLKENPVKGNLYFTTSLAGGVNFGDKFKGTLKKPESRFRIMPAVGLKYTIESISITADLEYTNTEFFKVGPVWLRVGAVYNIYFKNARAPLKIIKW